jgi:hypothetical protein
VDGGDELIVLSDECRMLLRQGPILLLRLLSAPVGKN